MHSWDINHTSPRLLNYSYIFFWIPGKELVEISPWTFSNLVGLVVFKLAWLITLTTWPFLFITCTFLLLFIVLSLCVCVSVSFLLGIKRVSEDHFAHDTCRSTVCATLNFLDVTFVVLSLLCGLIIQQISDYKGYMLCRMEKPYPLDLLSFLPTVYFHRCIEKVRPYPSNVFSCLLSASKCLIGT